MGEEKWLEGNLALCELINEDIASLVEVNFGINLVSTCFYCFHIVLVDFDLVLSRSTLSSCFCARDHLQGTLGLIGELLIQTDFLVSS